LCGEFESPQWIPFFRHHSFGSMLGTKLWKALTWHCGICCNPANGRLDFEKWLAYKNTATWYRLKCKLSKMGTVAFDVILATWMVEIGCFQWEVTPRGKCWISLSSAPASLTWNLQGWGLNPPLELPISDFMSASILFNSIWFKDRIGSCRPRFNPHYRQHFSVGIFHVLRTLTNFNWNVSMVK